MKNSPFLKTIGGLTALQNEPQEEEKTNTEKHSVKVAYYRLQQAPPVKSE
jgi:hypothetical protein